MQNKTEVIHLKRYAPIGYTPSFLSLIVYISDSVPGLIEFKLLNLDNFLKSLKSKRFENDIEWCLFQLDDVTAYCSISLSEVEKAGGFELFEANLLERWEKIEHGK